MKRPKTIPLEIEAALIAQEHRLFQVLWNYFHRRRHEFTDKDDPRRTASASALLWRIAAPSSLLVAGGTLSAVVVAVAGVFVAVRANDLITEQNRRIEQQTYLMEAHRRTTLIPFLIDVLDELDVERKTWTSQDSFQLSSSLLARVAGLSRALGPYKKLESSGELSEYDLSPERGQLLLALHAEGVLSQVADAWGSFAKADLRSVDLTEMAITQSFDPTLSSGLSLREMSFHEFAENPPEDAGSTKVKRADLQGANLQSALLYAADLRWADLTDADLSKALLQDANFRHALLTRAKLNNTKITGARFTMAYLKNAELKGAYTLDEPFLKILISNPDSENIDTNPVDFSGANLSQADLTAVRLWFAVFREADLRAADLTQADITGADLRKADLTEANLDSVRWKQVKVRDTNLYRVKNAPSGFIEWATDPNQGAVQMSPEEWHKYLREVY